MLSLAFTSAPWAIRDSGATKVVVPGGGDQLLVQPGPFLGVGLAAGVSWWAGTRLVGRRLVDAADEVACVDGPEVAGSPPLHAAVANTTAARTAKERTGLIGCMSFTGCHHGTGGSLAAMTTDPGDK